jgi:hypothetical protein
MTPTRWIGSRWQALAAISIALSTAIQLPAHAQPSSLLYVSDSGATSWGIKRADVATGAVIDTLIPLLPNGSPVAVGVQFTIAPDGSVLAAGGGAGSGGILRFDGNTGAFLGTVVANGVDGVGVAGLPNAQADGWLYVSEMFLNTNVYRYNSTSFVRDTNFRAGLRGDLAAGDLGDLFIPWRFSSGLGSLGLLSRFDAATGADKGTFTSFPPTAFPSAIEVGPDGELYVGDATLHQIYKVHCRTGAVHGVFVPPGSGGLSAVRDLKFGPDGQLYVLSDRGSARDILRFNGATGAFLGVVVSSNVDLTRPEQIDFAGVQPGVCGMNNRPPAAHAVGDPVAAEGSTFQLAGFDSVDLDGDRLTYAWTQVAGPSATPSGRTDLVSVYFTAPVLPAGTRSAVMTFRLTVTDIFGAVGTDSVDVRVGVPNDPPVCDAAIAQPAVLWPPNHQLVPIAIAGLGDPDGDPVTATITSVSQDEPTLGLGDGDTAPDAIVDGQGQSVRLRAERSGRGNGRVYRLHFTASDGPGSCEGMVKVAVPVDLKVPAVDDGPP